MLAYDDVVVYLTKYLETLGTYSPLPVFSVGVDADAQDISPYQLVLLTVGAGAGFDVEGIFDQPAVQVRTVGAQQDYNSGERLARDLDKAMFALGPSSTLTNGKRVLTVSRTGGGPSLLLKDDGGRYHFTCNYIWEVEYD
jgi:hypothetical protein